MPIKQAAYKALRQTKKHTIRNRAVKAKLHVLTKSALKSINAKEVENAKKQVQAAVKALDKAAQHGILKKNTAARKKSRLMKRMNAALKNA
ncbi:MAG: 30S ribosomal protein S20 [Candidatus Kerfeldbacteria bacterium]|nr:30S ribosomal protein S20 [Candidatus Kerfeldbacteria bacterium]